MEEYIKKLLEQVRFRQAHDGIEKELKAHMEDQIADYMADGMDRNSAEKAAVADMGDPVEVGISMDRVHRPKIAWSVVLIAMLIGIASIILHALIVQDAAVTNNATSILGSPHFYTNVVIGLISMLTLYLLDYTVLAKYSKILALAMLMIVVLGTMGFFLYGVGGHLHIGPFSILTSTFMFFYIPLFGAILYKYRGGGFASLLRALLWMVIPVILAIGWSSLTTAIMITFTMILQLSVAIAKGWFKVPKMPVIIISWAAITVVPIGFLAFAYTHGLMAQYQMMRIRAIFHSDGDAAYVINNVRSLLREVHLFSGTGKNVFDLLPNPNSDYLFVYLINKYGLVVAFLPVIAAASLIITGFIASARCKNQLGLVMGVGCMNVLLINMLVNCFSNMGLIPYMNSFLPFFSAGGSNVILGYIFLGIILSIYKYKEAYPQHVDVKVRGKIKLGKIEIIKN